MIKIAEKPILQILSGLGSDKKILDVGGAIAPFKRANYLIDYVPYESINWSQLKGDGETCFSKETYKEFDICSRAPFPFPDKFFDYSICSHVLEDIRDPLWVCSALIRISKAGYIEIPSRIYETTFGLEARGLAGASHHRWIIELKGNILQFTFKFMHVHSKVVNRSRIRLQRNDPSNYLRLEWQESFIYEENWLNSGPEVFEYFLGRPIDEKEKWKIYRKLDPRPFPFPWLSYLKNTNFIFSAIFKAFKRND